MNLRIVFMGTPDFAVSSLEKLHQSAYKVVGVVTATDKYGGRGNKVLIESPVKKYAEAHKIPVLQPKNLKAPEFTEALRQLDADIQVVVAFRMLPEVVWNMPPLGTMNLHGSLLPKYRGAAPINWAVINGDKETGVTTFFLKHAIDTGDILFQAKMDIGENETAGEVYDRMKVLGAEVVLESIIAVDNEEIVLSEQDDSLVSKAPKIFTETCEINFNKTTEEVHNFIRGLSPYPTAWTMLKDKKLKIYSATKSFDDKLIEPGKFISDNKNILKISTKDGYIEIHELQLQGKKRMQTKAFLNGFKFD